MTRAGRLDGKVVIITGGARGMGAAEARMFADEGAHVVITDVLEEDGRALAKSLGGSATFLRHDVTSADDWDAVTGVTLEVHGRIDGLVNNAGITSDAQLRDTTEADFRHMVDINQLGVFLGMKAVAPSMVERKAGSIVNVSSTGGLRASAGLAYGATKWAVRGMTKTVAMEVGPAGVRVNSIHPGVVLTPMLEDVMAKGFGGQIAERIPLRRIGEPQEVAYMALFLISDESRYSTGSEFVVDGGVTAMGMGQR